MKLFFIICLCFTAALPANALTFAERKMVQQAQVYVREAMTESQQTKDALVASDARAAAAEKTSADTAANLEVVKKQVDAAAAREKALAALNAKMKPVYDEVRKYWGLGAIGYGFKELIKHILIAAIVGGVLIAGLYILSFFFPLVGVALAAIVKIFHGGFSAVGGILKRVMDHLKPKR